MKTKIPRLLLGGNIVSICLLFLQAWLYLTHYRVANNELIKGEAVPPVNHQILHPVHIQSERHRDVSLIDTPSTVSVPASLAAHLFQGRMALVNQAVSDQLAEVFGLTDEEISSVNSLLTKSIDQLKDLEIAYSHRTDQIHLDGLPIPDATIRDQLTVLEVPRYKHEVVMDQLNRALQDTVGLRKEMRSLVYVLMMKHLRMVRKWS